MVSHYGCTYTHVIHQVWEKASDDAAGTAAKISVALQGVATVISGFAAVLAADSKAKIAAIEDQIKMEKKLDGKSEESLAKIKAMEIKKEQMARKQFERNKQLQIANAISPRAQAAINKWKSHVPLPM